MRRKQKATLEAFSSRRLIAWLALIAFMGALHGAGGAALREARFRLQADVFAPGGKSGQSISYRQSYSVVGQAHATGSGQCASLIVRSGVIEAWLATKALDPPDASNVSQWIIY